MRTRNVLKEKYKSLANKTLDFLRLCCHGKSRSPRKRLICHVPNVFCVSSTEQGLPHSVVSCRRRIALCFLSEPVVFMDFWCCPDFFLMAVSCQNYIATSWLILSSWSSQWDLLCLIPGTDLMTTLSFLSSLCDFRHQ